MRVWRVDRLGPIAVTPIDLAVGVPNAAGGIVVAHRTTEGFLRARARIARSGVLEYGDGRETWGELRTVDELAKAAGTFALVLVTDDHPDDFVDAENARELGVGFLAQDLAVEPGPGGPADDSYLVGTITITDAATIAKIEAGKQELSIGFSCVVVETQGLHDGASYRFRQTNLEGNHTALVEAGRAGPIAKIPTADSIRATLRGAAHGTRRIDQAGIAGNRSDTMDPVTIEIPNVGPVDVPAAVADYIAALQTQLQAAAPPAQEAVGAGPGAPAVPGAPAAAPAPAAGQPTVVVIPARAGDAAIRAERDAAVARAANLEATIGQRIDERVELVAQARSICGDAISAGMHEAEVHRAVALAVFPTLKAKIDAIKPDKDGKLSADQRGYLRALHDRAVESWAEQRGDVEGAVHEARQHADGGDDFADIYELADGVAARRSGRTPAAK